MNMNKTLLTVAFAIVWLVGTSSAQTRELTTRSGAETQQSAKLSSISANLPEGKPQNRGGSSTDCDGRIHYKEVYKALMDEKVTELIVKVLGGESRSFKYPFGKSELRDNGVMTIYSENGSLTIDFCGVYMIERKGAVVEVWINL